jgi:hypothetical protein
MMVSEDKGGDTMHPWYSWKLADERTAARHQVPTRVTTPPGALSNRRARRQPGVWLGYWMIGVGCRLARPALVVGAARVRM